MSLSDIFTSLFRTFRGHLHHPNRCCTFKCMVLAVSVVALMAGCASIGNPSGGPRDEDPPEFVRSVPEPGAVNVHGRKMTLWFNELINLRDAFSQVTVSPPSKHIPKVTSSGRRVNIEFTDSLLPNTTYSVDFGTSIEDNNEGNKLEHFQYVFSTGPVLDTLRISGMVLGALDLEPQKGMIVGVHSNLADSAFTRLPFERVARTDDRGRFILRGLAPGNYRLFALQDSNSDWLYSSPEEAMAFYDVVVSPYSEQIETTDSIFNLTTGDLDTTMTRQRTLFLPNDVLLRSFTSARKQQFIALNQRIDSTRIQLIFNAPQDSAPRLGIVGAPDLKDWYRLERSRRNDTLTYWLTSNSIISVDTLRVSVPFMRSDSAWNQVAFCDTLRLITSRPRITKNDKKSKAKKDTTVQVPTLAMNILTSTTHDAHRPAIIEFATPLKSLDHDAFRLMLKKDTLWVKVPGTITVSEPDSLTLRRVTVSYPWEFGAEYRLEIDSLAATGIYGLSTAPLQQEIRIKKEEDYCSLRLNIVGLNDSIPAFVELLNTNDSPLRREQVRNNSVMFRWLTPGKYNARLYEDFNGNGEYDPGEYDLRQQPDLCFYFPKSINIKKNWDKEETWDVWATPIDMQKPDAIKKNKPDTPKNKKNTQTTPEEEDDDDTYVPDYNPFDPNSGKKQRSRHF